MFGAFPDAVPAVLQRMGIIVILIKGQYRDSPISKFAGTTPVGLVGAGVARSRRAQNSEITAEAMESQNLEIDQHELNCRGSPW